MTNILHNNPCLMRIDAFSSGDTHTAQKLDYGKIHVLPINKLVPNPLQPRKHFDDTAIIGLADSIRRYGVLQPICVRIANSDSRLYEIIAGERRYRAAKLLGLSNVPCILMKADDLKSAELSLVENLHRENLNYFELAGGIASLIDIFDITQEECAKILSVSQSFVANKLRLLKFTSAEREKILTYGLSERHARALLRIRIPEQRIRMIEYINLHNLNVATTESYIDKYLSDSAAMRSRSPQKIVLKDIRVFYNTINRAINIVKQAGIDVVSSTLDIGDAVELTIRVPKHTDVSRETSDADTEITE